MRSNNPVFKTLLVNGVTSTDGQSHRLPTPIMSDGLSAEQQDRAIRTALEGKTHRTLPAEVGRRTAHMPTQRRPKDEQLHDSQRPLLVHRIRGHRRAKTGGTLHSKIRRPAKHPLAEIPLASLQSRQLDTPAPKSEFVLGEAYGHLRYRLLNKVELAATGRAYVSRQPDSILAAGLVDPRFRTDAEFPNQWRPLERNEVGNLIPGDPRPYDGGAGYLKTTRLAGHDDALFVEGHLLIIEPIDWFRGRNQLRAKLPAIIQSQIRDMRRAMLKASQAK